MRDLYPHRRLVATLALLYLSQGVPMGLAMDALPTLLRRDGAPLHALAFLPLVGLPWVGKFLWAPLVDNHGGRRLGRRRSWILPMQAMVCLCLLALAATGLGTAGAGWAVAAMVVASLCSATQDIASDGMAAEHFEGSLLAGVNAIQVAGVMVGFFVGGAGTLMLAGHFGQRTAFALLAGIPLLGLLCALRLPAHGATQIRPERGASLLRFARRPGAFSLLVLALLSAVTAVSGFGLSRLFLSDMGWSLEAIGQLGMAGGAVTIVAGCGGGAWLARRLGVWGAFSAGAVCAAVAAACWVGLSAHWLALRPGWVWTAAILGSLATGVTSVAMLTAGMRFASRGGQAGTDVTAVQSTRDLGEMLASSMLVALAARAGYPGGFAVGATLAIVALCLGWRLRRGDAAG